MGKSVSSVVVPQEKPCRVDGSGSGPGCAEASLQVHETLLALYGKAELLQTSDKRVGHSGFRNGGCVCLSPQRADAGVRSSV